MVGKPFHIVTKAVLISFVKIEHLAKYQSGSCQDGLKLQNTAMQLLSFIFLTNIKL